MPTKKTSSKKKTTKQVGFKEISNELNDILGLIKVNFENAWKSEEKAKIEKHLHKGVSTLSQKLTNIVDLAKKGELDDELMKQMHKGLQSTSKALKKSAKNWKTPQKKTKKK